MEREKFIFDLYDLNQNGIIMRDEIVTVLHNIKPTMTNQGKEGTFI
jgi:Ca2+-binding EF-hand superfamily protein